MKKSKRNLIPKPEKLTAKERGIVQWIARFESGYRRKRIGTRFFVFGNKSEDIISLLLSSCKKMKKLVDKLFEGWYYSQRR